MALLFIDSFDNYSGAPIAVLGKWQTYVPIGSGLIIASGAGRNGTNALKVVLVVVPGN